MADIFQDLGREAIASAGNTFATAINGTAGLTSIDFKDAGANRVTVIAATASVSGSGKVTLKGQESDDNSSWVDIANGSLPQTTAAQDLNVLSMNVSKRYFRVFGTLDSGTSVTAAVIVLAMRKSIPANFGGFVNDTYQ